jgi:hypothetical protein
LRRRPHRDEHDRADDDDLAPENFCGGQGFVPETTISLPRNDASIELQGRCLPMRIAA